MNPILWKDDRLRIVLTVDYHSRWIRPDPNESYLQEGGDIRNVQAYLIFVIFFTRAKFLENKIYTEKRQFFALNL